MFFFFSLVRFAMPKAKHRKRVRAARVDAAHAPIATEGHATNGNEPAAKKVGKKEAEVTAILDKLRSADAKERIQGSVRFHALTECLHQS